MDVTFYFVNEYNNTIRHTRHIEHLSIIPNIGDDVWFSLKNSEECLRGEYIVSAKEFNFEDGFKIIITLKRKKY